jgi:ParB-like chromosome segregation protein Spo0J
MTAPGTRPIAEIGIGERHRKERGDLQALADSIQRDGLLQPIGITAVGDLVFGERRLRACADILGWTEIPVRVVEIETIARGEYAENEMRKDFTPSEKVPILQTLDRKQRGGNQTHRADRPDKHKAAKLSGFSSRKVADRARTVVKLGTPELVAAMDKEEISIDAAAVIAKRPPEAQRQIVALPARERHHAIEEARLKQVRQAAQNRRKPHTISIPWNALRAATVLLKSWPRDLVRDFADELHKRLAGNGASDNAPAPEENAPATIERGAIRQ